MNEMTCVSNVINELDISLNYGELYFEIGEQFSVDVKNTLEKDVFVEENGNRLSIWDERKKGHILFVKKEKNYPVIKITLPAEKHFRKIKFVTGAGEFHADNIKTDQLIFKMGAGEFHIQNIEVSACAQIDGGAGEIDIENGTIHDLNMSFGAGEVSMNAAITGDSRISAGVGELNLRLLGSPSAYSATISKGIGHCSINGFSTCNGNTYGEGPNRLKIKGGIGEIRVTFHEYK